MKESRRTLRMQRHHNRRKDRNATLNMVSLMDIFTILVFFLLVSASESEVLPMPKQISLPESIAEKPPKQNLIIMVGKSDILLQGQKIIAVRTALNSNEPVIQPLMRALKLHEAGTAAVKGKTDPKAGITIMADKQIPYKLLKKIMLTSASADFTNISLAVSQKASEQEGSP
jgi:biopolymer transport protein TolR